MSLVKQEFVGLRCFFRSKDTASLHLLLTVSFSFEHGALYIVLCLDSGEKQKS